MRDLLVIVFICLQLLAPVVHAESAKAPLDVSIKQYGFVLAMALLGGLVSWVAKVRRGELAAANLFHLVGELATSALSGLLAFFLMQWLNTPDMLQAAIVGVAGHAGTKGLQWAEDTLKKRASRALGVDEDKT